MEKLFTIVVFTENKIGLLNRVTSLFTQRHINIESLTVSESEFHGIHRFTIVILQPEDKVMKVVKQIEKQVEVLKAYYFPDEETVYSEVALYKLRISSIKDKDMTELERVLKKNGAVERSREGDFLIIEKTGHKEETQKVFEELGPFGLQGFVRSGRVSLSKSMPSFSGHLEQFESHSKEIISNHN